MLNNSEKISLPGQLAISAQLYNLKVYQATLYLKLHVHAADPKSPKASPRNLENDMRATLSLDNKLDNLRTSHDNPMFEASLDPEAGEL